jgi:histidinol-phosphatase (PHP family)
MLQDDFDDWRMRLGQLDEYVDSVRKAQRDVPQVAIRLALEVDYMPGQEPWIVELRSRHPWDYFIGSVHYLGEWVIDHQVQREEWEQRDVWEVWCAYFDRLTMAAESGLFEIIGHPDLPKKFGHRPARDCAPLYERFLKAASGSDCALDVNTAGLRKECREIYPSRRFLELAIREGVPITFGSDAHAPEEVGMDFGEAIRLARSVGYSACIRFAARQREAIPL